MDRCKLVFSVAVLQAMILMSGCASAPVMLAKLPPEKYKIIGKASGRACGTIGVLGPAITFIPFDLNSRIERAQQAALRSVPGATGLINVELQDDWYWWYLATTRCTTIAGDAIMEQKR
ncbi:MAG: hypothetical protein U1E83_06435 [Methylotetracoccus sp.]